MKVLPFQKRHALVTSQHGVLARPSDERRDVLTGEVPADAARYSDPMRRLTLRKCEACGAEWTQPAITGACPHCHSGHVVTVDVKTIYAARV